jgi:hypothetical protein
MRAASARADERSVGLGVRHFSDLYHSELRLDLPTVEFNVEGEQADGQQNEGDIVMEVISACASDKGVLLWKNLEFHIVCHG